MTRLFQITQRHYEIIIKQAMDNYPQESGGALGGKEDLIQAVFPISNQYLYARTDTFQITKDDILRAHAFFQKHGLEYYGVYHSHPKGVPYPSKTDLDTGERYHFIIGLKDRNKPILNAFECQSYNVTQILIHVVSMKGFDIVDIHAKSKPALVHQGMVQEEIGLHDMLNQIRRENPRYPKLKSQKPGSEFSTMA